jgi:hypothetical protein
MATIRRNGSWIYQNEQGVEVPLDFLPQSVADGPPATAYTQRWRYDVKGRMQYQAWALSAGAPKSSEAKWAICKFSYEGDSSSPTLREWCKGSTALVNILDNVEELEFS